MTAVHELANRRPYISLLAELLRRYPYRVPKQSWVDDPDCVVGSAAYERLRQHLNDALAHLDLREQEVLRLRHGLHSGGHVWPYTEIEVRWGVSATRIRQILERAYWKLRRSGGVEQLLDALDPSGRLRSKVIGQCGQVSRAS